MQEREIGLRAQDVQTGLQDVDLRGPAAGLFDTTLLTGMAERLAIHLRGSEVIDDERRLYAVADRLGIESLLLPRVLRTLEEAGFVKVESSGGRPRKIIERVPYFDDIYQTLGEAWKTGSPTEEEEANLQLLDDLVESPQSVEALQKSLGLDESQLDVVLRVGKDGGYLGEFASKDDEERIVYSPLYWEEKPEETFKLLKQYGGSRVAEAVRKVRSYQGMPMPDLKQTSTKDDQIIVEAMAMGLLPTPEVVSFAGAKRFAFTPYQGQVALTDDERAILQKARVVLACVRYGEHFGSVTKVRDAEAIIGALSRRGRIGPHSEIARQYAILVVEGVARIARDTTFPGRYHVQLIDTEENRKALQVAADMLSLGEAITERGLVPEAKALLFNGGSLKDPPTTRSDELLRRKRMPQYPKMIIEKEVEKLIDDIRGL